MRGTSASDLYLTDSVLDACLLHASRIRATHARTTTANLLLTKGLQYLIGVLTYIDLVKDLRDLALLVDQEGLSHRAHVLFAVHRLFAPDAVCLDDLLVRVGE